MRKEKGVWAFVRRLTTVPERKPFALPMDEWCEDGRYTWNDWHRDMRERYPIRYFLGERIPVVLRRAKRAAWDIPKQFVLCHVDPRLRHHKLDLRSPENGYRYGWTPPEHQLLLAMFAVLSQAMKPRHYRSTCDDDGTAKAHDEMYALHRWWTEERPAAWKELERVEGGERPPVPGGVVQRLRRFVDDIFRPSWPSARKGQWKTAEHRARMKAFWEKTLALNQQDEEMMRRLVAIRIHLECGR